MCHQLWNYLKQDRGKENADGQCQQEQCACFCPVVMNIMRNDRSCKVYNRSMNTECDNGISPQIRNDAYSFYFLTDQHNHKDSGKCGNVYLEYVAGIIVGPHTRRGGGEVHYDQCQQDK